MTATRLALIATLWLLDPGLSLSLSTTPSSACRRCDFTAPKQRLSQAVTVGSIGLALFTTAACALPRPAQAATAEVVNINADIPALIQIAKDNKDTILKLAQQASSAVSITKLPSNWLEFARDAAAGDVYIEINGIPLDISLLSDKGIIDVDVSTTQGDVSLTVSSKLIPKLPFFPKRPVQMSRSTGRTTTTESMTSQTPPSPSRPESSAVAVASDNADKIAVEPFSWNGWSLQQILGTSALSLGGIYGASYTYYVKLGEEEELAAQEKRKATLAKIKVVHSTTPTEVPAVEATKKGEENSSPITTPPIVEKIEPQPTKDKETVAETSKSPKRTGISQTTMSGSNFTSFPPLPKKDTKPSSWKFWQGKR